MNTEMQFLDLGLLMAHTLLNVFLTLSSSPAPPWPFDWANHKILKCSTDQCVRPVYRLTIFSFIAIIIYAMDAQNKDRVLNYERYEMQIM